MKEIELRARLDEEKYQELLTLLKQKDPQFTSQKQLSFSASTPFDVRVKQIDDGDNLVNLKKGTMADNSRKEIGFTIKKEDRHSFFSFLNTLGFTSFVQWEKFRHSFSLGEVQVDLDKITNFGNYIEFEKSCPNNVDEEKVLQELHSLMQEFGLEPTPKEEFVAHVEEYTQKQL